MNYLASKPLRLLAIALCLVLNFSVEHANAQAVTNYWDTNGSTPGSGGPTPNGNWEDPSWTTDPTGSSPTGTWTEGSVPVFSAGTDATGAYTITANSSHTVAGVQAPSGSVTINGPGVLTNAAGLQLFSGTNLTINAVLAGSGGFESAASNNVYLYGNNTYSGGTSLNGGSTYINNNNSLGTGAISPIAGGTNPNFSALYFNGGAPITLTNNFNINTSNAGIVMPLQASTPAVLNGNWALTQDLYLRAAPSAADVSTNVYLNGVISGTNNVFYSANVTKTYFVPTTNNTYSGKTTIGSAGGSAAFLAVTNFNSFNGGTPPRSSSSLGYPTVDPVVDCGTGAGGAACGFDYFGPGETTDRGFNNINTPTGGMLFYADGTGPLVLSGNITAVNSTSNRTLTIEGGSTSTNTISGTISDGSGGGVVNVTKDGTSTWALTGTNTFSGFLTTQTGGLLLLGGSNVYTGNTTVSTGSALKLIAAYPIPFGSGKGNLSIGSGATFDLAGNNCTVNGGAACAGTIDCTSGAATLTIGNNGTAQNATYSSVIQDTSPGTLNLTVNSGGTLQLTSAGNTYAGNTTVNNAVLQITAENQLGATPATLVTNSIILDHNLGFNPGTGANTGNYYLRLQTTASVNLTANRGIYLGNTLGYGGGVGAQSAKTLNIYGPISGPGGLWVGGGTAGAGIGSIYLYNQSNTYSGGTYIVGGNLSMGTNNVLPAGTPLFMGVSSSGSGTYFYMKGFNQTIGPLTGFGTPNGPQIQLTGALDIIQTNNTTFFGFITSSGGSLTLDATSTGTLTLAAGGSANNYTGPTIINGGTLALTGTVTIGSSTSITIGNKGTFDVSGLNSALTLGASQTLNAGGTGGLSATINTASGKGLTLGTTTPLNFTAYDGSTVPLAISGAGSVTLAAGNPVTVTVSGSALAAGTYKLISKGASGSVAGTAPTSVTLAGAGTVANVTNSLSISNAELYLSVVVNLAPVTHMSIAPAGGGTLSINYSGGSASQFVLLQATNVAAPLASWARVQTNTASTGSFTITPGTNAAGFYKIQSQ